MAKKDLSKLSKDDLGEYIARKLPKVDLIALAQIVQDGGYTESGVSAAILSAAKPQ
jgi:hypothetical protein